MPSFLMQRKEQIMKSVRKPVLAIVIVLTAVLFSACSQSTYSHKGSMRRASASHIDPVSQKKYPLRKNYIVPVKRKPILGLKKPKI